MAHADEERVTIATALRAFTRSVHAEQVERLRRDALMHRAIAHELELRARMIECHVDCGGDPACCATVDR